MASTLRAGPDDGPVARTLLGAAGAGGPARLVETHTAYVLLLDGVVLKWKKPVDLGFVDFRTPQSRARACQDEVALNRRLAPDVYRGVHLLTDETGRVVEHVVVMRRLPDDRRLSTLVAAGADLEEPVRRLARVVAAFHSRCAPCADAEAVAGADRLRELWEIGLGALRELAPLGLDVADVEHADRLVHEYLAGRATLLADRIARGHVRDGHGDLLADDVFLLDDGPRVLDCLDFDATLRQGDVLNDVAMLLMDLERLGAGHLAAVFERAYREFSGETHPASLLDLYTAYRAGVRAKVALLRAAQLADAGDREEQVGLARRLVDLMVAHLERAQVRLVLVGGLPGTGKSTLAESLSGATGWLVHSSDLVRAELRIPTVRRYAQEWKDAVYRELLARAAADLASGWSTVLDATWSDARRRQAAADVAGRAHARVVELECRAEPQVALERLRSRPAGHPSDADPGAYRALEAERDPWPAAEVVDCSLQPAESVARALELATAAGPGR